MIVIIFGVSGAGKTTIGKLLAHELGWRFIEADDFHPAANVEKMRSGRPLTDEDRWPWLERIYEEIKRSIDVGESAVLACSALKRAYRDPLRPSAASMAMPPQDESGQTHLDLYGRKIFPEYCPHYAVKQP